MSLPSSMLLVILISMTAVFYISESLKNEKENPYFIGSINNPEYVGHGEVTNIENFSCDDSEVLGDSEFLFLNGDKLYSTSISGEEPNTWVSVKSHINPKNKNEVITSISAKGDNNIKVPLLLRCEEKEKEVIGLNSPIKTGLEVIGYNDLCGEGEPIVPFEKEDIVSENVLIRTNVTFDYKGDNLVIQRDVLNYIKDTSGIMTYPVEESTEVDFELNTENYPLKIKCSYKLENKNIKNGEKNEQV